MNISFAKRGLGMAVVLFAALFLAAPASAVDFKISGQWLVGFEYSNVMPRHSRHTGNDYFGAMQRFRVQMEAVASEQLSGTVQLELGKVEWGNASTGGALGTDGKIAKVRFAYIEWMIPNTEIKVRMGLQNIALPGVISNYGLSPIFGKEMAGIVVNSPIYHGNNFSIDATAFWARPYNDNATNPKWTWLDNMDNFAIILPIKGDGFSIKPYFMYSMMGKYSMTDVAASMGDSGIVAPRGGLMPVMGDSHYYSWFQNNYVEGLDRKWGDGIWAGLAAEVNLTDALKFSFEGIYGSTDWGDVKHYTGFNDGKNKTLEVKREGWYVGGKLEYKFDWGVPGIIAWYGSGDDDNPYNGSERLPQYNTPWAVSSLGFGGGVYDDMTWKVLGHNPSGLIGVIAQIDKLSFIEKLNHTLRFGYYWGTNSSDMPKKANMTYPTRADGPSAYLTTTDDAWEVNFITNYKMYENFTISLDCGYVRLNLDDDTWRGAQKANWQDNYRAGLAFNYSF